MSDNPVEKTALLNGVTAKSIRLLTDYTQKGLEEDCNIHGQRVSLCETGARCFKEDEIALICETMGVDQKMFYKLRKLLVEVYDGCNNPKYTYKSEL